MNRFVSACVLFGAVLGLLGIAAVPARAIYQDPRIPPPMWLPNGRFNPLYNYWPLEAATFYRLNEQRRNNGLPEFVPNAALGLAAMNHASNMASTGTFAHEIDGQNPSDRARAAGYPTGDVGEVIAWRSGGRGRDYPRLVVEEWMDSNAHRGVLLNARYVDIGVAMRFGGGRAYFCVVVGAPR